MYDLTLLVPGQGPPGYALGTFLTTDVKETPTIMTPVYQTFRPYGLLYSPEMRKQNIASLESKLLKPMVGRLYY